MTYLAAPELSRADTSWMTEWRRTVDWPILLAALMLLGFGLLLSLAAGPPAAERMHYSDPYFFVVRQAVFACGAGVLLLAGSIMDRQLTRRLAALVFILAFLLMAIILLAGHEAKGAQRWIRLFGFSLQPSEMVKPALIVLIGWLLAQRQLFPNGPWAVLAFSLYAVTLGLLLLQPDVGQSVLLTGAFVLTFFISGLPLRWAAGFAGGGLLISSSLYALLPHVRQRINSFLNPSAYDTYQIDKAAEAISRGGVFGAGPGEGTVKSSLPDAHTDFVYAVLGEEYGLIATLVVIGIYAFITLRGLMLTAKIEDPYARAAATGLFSLFGLQTVINVGVNVALFPPKGMTLPFISYGGSSLVGTALTLGFALALVRRSTHWRRRI
ncbi:MAG: putative lipid II flippase FtsW [Hyphomonadaceae bacterium]|nr:putative lipid II flippase FtsW [Hyphomonadaceae bacterium]